MKIKTIIQKLNQRPLFQTSIVLFILIFSSVSASLALNLSTAYANCSEAKVSMSDLCVQKNCDIAGLSSSQCIKVINDCANTTKFIFTNASQIGNCANAMRSCYENLIDTSSCTNNGILATAASCNNGNVDAGATSTSVFTGVQCGLDAAIDAINKDSGVFDFTSNKGIQGQRKDALQKGCNQEEWTFQQIGDCQKNLQKNFDACYSENGGTAKKFTDEAYANCIASKATNAGDCIASGGTWSGQKCEPPRTEENTDGPTDSPNQQAEDTPGNLGDRQKSKCGVKANGEAIKTNIIGCTSTDSEEVLAEILKIGLQALSVLVGVAAVGGIAWASVKYAKAEDNDNDVKEAKDLIRNVIIGLLAYLLMIAIINWLVPGGVIG